MKKILCVASHVVAVGLLFGAGYGQALAAMSCDEATPWKCTFAYKKVLWCDGERYLDNGACAATAEERLAATEAKCAALGYPAPSGYDNRGRQYSNFKLSSPLVPMTCADNADCVAPEVCAAGSCHVPANPCMAGGKRYWKYSCCEYRHCGDLIDVAGTESPDGKATLEDLLVLGAQVNGVVELEGQIKKAADLDGDGEVTGDDVNILTDYVSLVQVVPFLCPLEPRTCKIPCGDANGDASGLHITDVQAVALWSLGLKLPTRCQAWASDINADGKLDAEDLAAIQTAWENGLLVPLAGCGQ